jgi:hypothetical protein
MVLMSKGCLSSFLQSIIMNIKTFALMGILLNVVSLPLFAEIAYTPSPPPQIAITARTNEQHQQAADINRQHADHHTAMSEYYKSLAREYKNFGSHALQEHYKDLSKSHHALSKEYAATALTHKKAAKFHTKKESCYEAS